MVSVEIDAMILEVAKTFTEFREAERNKVVINDGRRFLQRSKDKYGLGDPRRLCAQQPGPAASHHARVLQVVKDHLEDDGVFATNVHGGTALFQSHVKTMTMAFPQVVFFPVGDTGSIIAMAVKFRSPNLLQAIAQADVAKLPALAAFGVDFAGLKKGWLTAKDFEVPRNTRHLSDDFAPRGIPGHPPRAMRNTWLFPTVLALALFQGFLGMGFQLVASRLLAPYFGTTLIVWAFLISSFLAAFSLGSFFGGSLSRLTGRSRRKALIVLVIVGVGWFGIVAFAGRPVMRCPRGDVRGGLGRHRARLRAAVPGSGGGALGAAADLHGVCLRADGGGRGAGSSSGLIYGTSTFGNIVGVMVTAFALIPNFLTSELLVGWFVCSFACFAGAYQVDAQEYVRRKGAALTAAPRRIALVAWRSSAGCFGIIAFPVGGLLDTVSRIVGEKMSACLGQQFIIEARPGAGGTLATAAVAKAEPDGYTVMMINDNHALNPHVFKNIPYDSVKDFAPIGFVGSTPMVFVAHPSVPAHERQEPR